MKLGHPNAVGLIAVNSELGEARVGIDELLRASLRMRPDRLMVGEIRGAEAFHIPPRSEHRTPRIADHGSRGQPARRDGPDRVHDAAGRTDADARRRIDYAKSVIDVVVQLSRSGGKRGVSQVVTWRNARGRIVCTEKQAPAAGAGKRTADRGSSSFRAGRRVPCARGTILSVALLRYRRGE